MNNPIYSYSSWIRSVFAFPVQKISIDAGFTCPNRDGTVGYGGCTFCDNLSFNPSYCTARHTVKKQIEDGKAFFARKYPAMKYLAYFQAYSNTYSNSIERLKSLYEEALAEDGVVGLVIGTRPDCVSEQLLDYIERLSGQTFVTVEYGIESANDRTLKAVNRGHTFECARKAIEQTAERGIITGGHVIIGLPGEDAAECLRQAPIISSLKLTILKLHQMQIIKGTRLARQYAEHPFHTYSAEEYMKLVARYLQLTRKDMVMERFVSQSPKDMVIAPKWGLKNYEFTNMLVNYMKANDIYQGQLSTRKVQTCQTQTEQ